MMTIVAMKNKIRRIRSNSWAISNHSSFTELFSWFSRCKLTRSVGRGRKDMVETLDLVPFSFEVCSFFSQIQTFGKSELTRMLLPFVVAKELTRSKLLQLLENVILSLEDLNFIESTSESCFFFGQQRSLQVTLATHPKASAFSHFGGFVEPSLNVKISRRTVKRRDNVDNTTT